MNGDLIRHLVFVSPVLFNAPQNACNNNMVLLLMVGIQRAHFSFMLNKYNPFCVRVFIKGTFFWVEWKKNMPSKKRNTFLLVVYIFSVALWEGERASGSKPFQETFSFFEREFVQYNGEMCKEQIKCKTLKAKTFLARIIVWWWTNHTNCRQISNWQRKYFTNESNALLIWSPN